MKMRNGLYLFAQLRGPEDLEPGRIDRWRNSPTLILLNRLGLPTDWWTDDSGLKWLPRDRSSFELTVDEMPQFSVLTRFNDPAFLSGEIDPEHIPIALGNDENNSVRIESVTLQVTDQEVTQGLIGKILPWLDPRSGVRDNNKWNTYRWRDYVRCDMG